MRLALFTAPTEEPVSLAEAKLYLRIDLDADDTTIAEMVQAARIKCEAEVARSFVTTTWDLFLDSWPLPGWSGQGTLLSQIWGLQSQAAFNGQEIHVPRADLLSVVSIVYYATDGTLTTIDPSLYQVTPGAPGRIAPAYGKTWPSARSQPDAIRIRFTAGYGAASAVPATDKIAIKITLANLYENRGEDASAEIPPTAAALLAANAWGFYI